MSEVLSKRRILLGVTGSIAAYKAVDLASKCSQAGAQVDVILTHAAAAFVSPLTFQSVTGRKAYTDKDLWGDQGHVVHIQLGQEADLMVIAPATANTLSRLVQGDAGNLLTLTALAARCPLMLAPAMDGGMFEHPATQANLNILKERGAHLVGPESGHLASGLRAIGRMSEADTLLGHIRWQLGQGGPMTGRQIVVTAGGTHEAIDPVRYIANRSSGKQGYALAQAGIDLGARVTLISGPTALKAPVGASFIPVKRAEEMAEAVLRETEQADLLVMAAAVADFTPEHPAEEKIKKGNDLIQLNLKHSPDILSLVAQKRKQSAFPKQVVGFAAESQQLIENASKKLHKKNLDMIVANDILSADAGFEQDNNRVTLLFPDGRQENLPLMSKYEVAKKVLTTCLELLNA